MKNVKKENLGFYVFLGLNLLDVLMLPKSGPTNPVKIPLSTLISSDMVRIVTKTLGVDEQIVGSISIPQYIILQGGLASYTQWITLFEHQDDDEYDGQMGLNDDEEPKVLVNFNITQTNKDAKKLTQSSAIAKEVLQSSQTLKETVQLSQSQMSQVIDISSVSAGTLKDNSSKTLKGSGQDNIS